MIKPKHLTVLFLLIGIIAAGFAFYYAEQTRYGGYIGYEQLSNPVDSGADGGAAGFAVLSGLCFVATSISTLSEQKTSQV